MPTPTAGLVCQQFFISPEAVHDGKFRLTGPEAFHIAKVLRKKAGDSLVLFDGKGGRFEAMIKTIHPEGDVSGELTSTLTQIEGHPAVSLRLYAGLLKAAGWETVLQKGTELGVSSFHPVLTPRTVVLLHEAGRIEAKRERWGKILLAAAKQCGRAKLPELEAPAQFRDAIKACEGQGLSILAWEGLSGATAAESLRGFLREAMAAAGGKPVRVNLFIGPEGGFTEEEVELAESLGAVVFGLGRQTLRAETASMAAAAVVLYELGAL